MEKTWKPQVAGILNIISAIAGLLFGVGLIIAVSITGGLLIPGTENVPSFVPSLLTGFAIPVFICAIISLIGGIYAPQRKNWGWVLAGSISSIFASIPLLGGLPVGVTATVLTILSKEEFEETGSNG